MPDPKTISRFRKERYLRSMSEDEFRDTVVRPLFLRLGYGDGRDLCGPAEAGKDAIFTEVDRFDVTTVIAVQTKKGNLNLSSTASQNLIVAVTQLNTALQTSITLLSAKLRVRPQRAYLCVSGRINDAAREYILQQVSTPNITFLDTDELIPKIDAEIPEVWLGINLDLIPYFDGIRTLVEGGSAEEVAEFGHGATGVFSIAASDAKFVSLSVNRPVIRTRKQHGNITKYTDIEEFPLASLIRRKERRILILGEAGSGKSTGLLRLAYLMAQAGISEGGAYTIPILIRSLDVHGSGPASLADHCHSGCRRLSRRETSCFSAEDLVAGRVVILLDSLDELPTDDARSRVLTLVEQMLVAYPEVQVIATSRPYASHLPELNHYQEYRISPISWAQAKKILKIVKAHDRLTESQSQELLRKLDKIHGVALNPLLVTVFAATTDFSKQDIPANITELFKKFTELMLGRWDEAKGLRQQYQAPLKDFVLAKLGYYMHSQNRTSLDRREAEKIVRQELAVRGHEGDGSGLLAEIFERSGLFRIVENNVEFSHLLLQEFFAGRGIESIDQVKTAIGDEWWKRALVFYFGENPQRIDVLQESMKTAKLAPGQSLVTASTTVGLALQACYLSPVSAKLEVWRWVVSTLAEGMDTYIASISEVHHHRIIGFVQYYLYSRDSTALSNLSAHIPELTEWAKEDDSSTVLTDRDRLMFWLISGLIEAGEIESADTLAKQFRPRDLRLALGLHMGSHFTALIRPVDGQGRRVAKSMSRRLEESISGLRTELTKELDSLLLELRNGRPTAIDHDVVPDET